MDGIARLAHVEAGGFHAGGGVGPGDVELVDAVFPYVLGERLARERVRLRLLEDVVGDDLQLQHELGPPPRTRLESPHAGG